MHLSKQLCALRKGRKCTQSYSKEPDDWNCNIWPCILPYEFHWPALLSEHWNQCMLEIKKKNHTSKFQKAKWRQVLNYVQSALLFCKVQGCNRHLYHRLWEKKLLIYNLDAVVPLDGNSLSISSLKSCNFLKIIMGLAVGSCVNLLPSIS